MFGFKKKNNRINSVNNNKKNSKQIHYNEQIKGSLYGFFVGDALGVPVEFVGRETLKNNPIRDMEEYGTHNQPKGTWSDDSSMVLATIDSMYNNKEVFLQKDIFNYNDLMNRYSMWKNQAEYTPNQKVFDIGITTADAISRYESNKDNVFVGNDSFNANGNGSLMRIVPLALYTKYCIFNGYTIKLLGDNYDVIKKFSSLTHSHTLSIMSCYIYNIFVSNYLDLNDLNDAYVKMQKHFQNIFDGKIQKDYGDLELCKKYFNRLIYNDISKLNEKDIKSSGFVVDTLEASLWCVLTSKTFEESVLKAVNLGDDTDTIGALTGALAGLVYGVNSIPKKWLDCLQRKDYLDDMVNKYIELIQLRIKMNEDDWQKSKDEYFERERQSKFRRVTKDDWDIKPMTNNTKELKIDIKLTDEEWEYVKLGHKPLEMEDHFFMYYDDSDNSINYYRSWTGIQVYKAYYNINTKSIDRLVVHLVEEVNNSRINDEDLIKTFINLLNYDIDSRKKLKKKKINLYHNKLKRTDFINSIDSNKIWSKSMTMSETKLLLEQLENELSKHDFDEDKNFIMNARRKALKGMIEDRLQKSDNNTNELVSESLFNFWEFVGDEYPGGAGGIMSDCRELGISVQEFDAMDKSYREKGIICSQEKDVILEMIRLIKKYLNKDNNFDKIEFLRANYESPEQWAESTIKAHSHNEPIKEEYLEKLKKCKTWDDVLVLSKEVVPFLKR